MNKLKKLFSPSSLAATLATGLLLGSAHVAVADGCTSASVTDGTLTLVRPAINHLPNSKELLAKAGERHQRQGGGIRGDRAA